MLLHILPKIHENNCKKKGAQPLLHSGDLFSIQPPPSCLSSERTTTNHFCVITATMGHTKAERKKLALSRQYAEARSRGRGLSPVNPTPPINPPPPAPQQNVNPTASPAVVDIPPDHGEGGHTPADPDLNDDVCYLCGRGGHLL